MLLIVVLLGRMRPRWAPLLRQRRPALFDACRVVVLVLVFFCGWEGSLRLYAQVHPFQVFIPDPVTLWRVNPALRSLNESRRLHYPPRQMARSYIGFSGEEVKPEGTFRILCLGDSQAVASADRNNDKWHSYSKYLEKALRLTFPRRKLDVVNGGAPGFSSYQGVRLLRRVVGDMRPDVVVLAYGYHDSNLFLSMDHTVLTDSPFVALARRVLYRSQLFIVARKVVMPVQGQAYDRSREHFIYQRVPPYLYLRNYEDFMELARRHRFRLVILLQPHPAALPDESVRSAPYREAALRFARTYDLPVADCFGAFEKVKGRENDALFTDVIHMSSRGHMICARVLFDTLTSHGIPEPLPAK